LTRFSANWVDPERRSLGLPRIKELMATSFVEACHQGAGGATYDGMLLGQSWDFKLKEITFTPIYLWHGELDKGIPIAAVRAVAEKLPYYQSTC